MRHDAIVIGSGQGGNPLARELADQGWSVALIEKEHLGGSCVNTGCTPTKAMVARAQIAHYARNAARWGVRAGEVSVDLAEIVAQKDKVVQSFRASVERGVSSRPNLHLYRGQARFSGPRAVAVGDKTLESERIFINTGTHPAIPKIEGLDAINLPDQCHPDGAAPTPRTPAHPRRRLHRSRVRPDVSSLRQRSHHRPRS